MDSGPHAQGTAAILVEGDAPGLGAESSVRQGEENLRAREPKIGQRLMVRPKEFKIVRVAQLQRYTHRAQCTIIAPKSVCYITARRWQESLLREAKTVIRWLPVQGAAHDARQGKRREAGTAPHLEPESRTPIPAFESSAGLRGRKQRSIFNRDAVFRAQLCDTGVADRGTPGYAL